MKTFKIQEYINQGEIGHWLANLHPVFFPKQLKLPQDEHLIIRSWTSLFFFDLSPSIRDITSIDLDRFENFMYFLFIYILFQISQNKKHYWNQFQFYGRSKDFKGHKQQWTISYCSPQIIIDKITPSVDKNYWRRRLYSTSGFAPSL